MTYLHTSTLAPNYLHGGSPRPNRATTFQHGVIRTACCSRLFRLSEQLNTPPFVDSEIVRKLRGGMLQSPPAIAAPAPALQLALRRFSQDEAHAQ